MQNFCRWMVPAYSEIVIRIQFTSDDLGQFDQTLSFEITGTRRRYQLFCRGVCAFPTISREPRVVFPHRRKAKVTSEDIVSKKYLIQEEVFEFGPLLCGKTRERHVLLQSWRFGKQCILKFLNICAIGSCLYQKIQSSLYSW